MIDFVSKYVGFVMNIGSVDHFRFNKAEIFFGNSDALVIKLQKRGVN